MTYPLTVMMLGCAGGDLTEAAPVTNDPTCTANIVYGIWVHVNDRASGDPLNDAQGQVRSGSYVDTLRNDGAGDGVYIAASERAGTYAMHLGSQGYAAVDLSGIVVTRGICHVEPTVLYVRLEPAPQVVVH